MANTGDKVVTLLVAIIGVATLAVLFSTKADTANVIKSAGDALSSLLKVAVSPIAG